MTVLLRLESFGRAAPEPPPPPGFSAADLAAAAADGEARGRAAADTAAQASIASAVADLAAALADDASRRAELEAAWQARLAQLARAVVSTLAPAFRAEALAAAVIDVLRGEIALAPDPPPVVACESASQDALRLALERAGLGSVALVENPRGAEIAAGGGLASIDPDRVRAGLERIIAEMEDTDG